MRAITVGVMVLVAAASGIAVAVPAAMADTRDYQAAFLVATSVNTPAMSGQVRPASASAGTDYYAW